MKGYTVKGPSGKTIFLPLAGCSYDGKNYGSGDYGYYWTANNVSGDLYRTWAGYVKAGTATTVQKPLRRTGAAIRAVSSTASGGTTPTTAETYAVLSSDYTTLTFYYDNNKSSRSGMKYELNTGNTSPGWRTYDYKITTVVFNSSFANARPISCRSWFEGMQYLTSITGLTYLNTSEVTDMAFMFNNAGRLKSLNLSHFQTSKVTNMSFMFAGCTNLTSLTQSFDTGNVTDMTYMFWGCSELTSLTLNFNTSKVTSMMGMFLDCYKLSSIDLSYFDTRNVKYMKYMFEGCRKISRIDLSMLDFRSGIDTDVMFSGCTLLDEIDINATAKYWSSNTCVGVPDDCYLVYPIGVTESELGITYTGVSDEVLHFKGGEFEALKEDLLWAVTDFIDLGLPSKTFWNDENVGSIRPQYHGKYYAWGENRSKNDYTWANYSQSLVSNLKEYNFGYWNGNRLLMYNYYTSLSYDNDLYGSGIPTKAEFTELVNNCTLTETTIHGVKGVKFTSKNNGKFIFLPYAGSCYDGKTPDDGTSSYYWTSTSYNSDKAYAISLANGKVTSTTCQKRTGLPYRSVARYERELQDDEMYWNIYFGNSYIDGISNVNVQSPADGNIYTLQGVKVEGKPQPGIYVKNGRKVVVK